MSDLISLFLPLLLAAGGVIFGMFKSSDAKAHKADAERAKAGQMAQIVRAEIAEETTSLIIRSEKIAREKVKNARKIAEDKRGRFSNGTF